MTTEATRLQAIRDQLTSIAPGDWALAFDDEGGFVDVAGPAGERFAMARFSSFATNAEMRFAADAVVNARFLLALVDRAILALREQPQRAAPAAKDHAAEAAMLCGRAEFRAFLVARHGLAADATAEAAGACLRAATGVATRADYNRDADAAGRWKALRGDYLDWQRGQGR